MAVPLRIKATTQPIQGSRNGIASRGLRRQTYFQTHVNSMARMVTPAPMLSVKKSPPNNAVSTVGREAATGSLGMARYPAFVTAGTVR